MNYYFLPGIGTFGGIKVGFQFAEILASLGVRIAVATPGGMAPRWFSNSASVVCRDVLLPNLRPTDTVLFSLPQDYAILKPAPARLVFHCMGTDPLIDPILRDPSVTVLTCWQQAREYAEAHLRNPIEVGISVSDCFFYDGSVKEARRMAYMPRRGAGVTQMARECLPHLQLEAIDGANEEAVAATLKRSNYFLASSEGEWFGLPALEAMAAACVVVSLPVLGGAEYLIDRGTALVVATNALPAALQEISDPANGRLRDRLRSGAVAGAARYRSGLQKTKLRQALRGPLQHVFS